MTSRITADFYIIVMFLNWTNQISNEVNKPLFRQVLGTLVACLREGIPYA